MLHGNTSPAVTFDPTGRIRARFRRNAPFPASRRISLLGDTINAGPAGT
jgi:hypothetical protein